MRYLSAQDILVLHALVIDKTGGSHGVRDVELLASIAHKPRSRFSGKDLYSGLFKKAAVFVEAIVNYHAFVDGNKRTALVSGSRFLYINGYELTASNKEAEIAILKIAEKKIDIDMLEKWFKKNSQKISKKKKTQ